MKGWRNGFMVNRMSLFVTAITSNALNGVAALPCRIAPVHS